MASLGHNELKSGTPVDLVHYIFMLCVRVAVVFGIKPLHVIILISINYTTLAKHFLCNCFITLILLFTSLGLELLISTPWEQFYPKTFYQHYSICSIAWQPHHQSHHPQHQHQNQGVHYFIMAMYVLNSQMSGFSVQRVGMWRKHWWIYMTLIEAKWRIYQWTKKKKNHWFR